MHDCLVSFCISGEICFGFGLLFLGNTIMSYVLVLGVPAYSKKIFCRITCCCPSLPQSFHNVPIGSQQPTLVPAVLTVSQFLRDIASVRSRMTSTASTIPDRRNTCSTGNDINNMFFKRISGTNSSNAMQPAAPKTPARVTFQADSAVIVSLSPITEKPEFFMADETAVFDEDVAARTNNNNSEANNKQSVVTFHC